jgi:hypothetical protein
MTVPVEAPESIVWPRLVPLSEASDCDVDDDVDAARLRI